MINNRILRVLVVWFITSIGTYFLGYVLPGFNVSNIASALVVTILLGLVNALIWPIISKIPMRFLILVFGFAAFFLNGIIILLLSYIVPGIQIMGWGLLLAPLVIALINTTVSGLLDNGDDAPYFRSVMRNIGMKESSRVAKNRKIGFVFLEIDGLAEEILSKAIVDGKMPTLASWLSRGSHRIKGWETDLSSQSSASQAGILHGNNRDIPAFRWVEKANGNKIVSSNSIDDAPTIEARISDGEGLLANNGSVIATIFSGNAKSATLVYSKSRRMRELYLESWNVFYMVPYNYAYKILLFFYEIILEARSRVLQGRKKIMPRLKHRGLGYYLSRVGSNILLREVSTFMVIRDMMLGDKDIVYTTFFGYDEVSHHCGIADDESFYVLKKLDRCIRRIEAAKAYAPRPYHICVLSDHGQTNGNTFKQRYGYNISEFVESLLPEGECAYCELDSNQDHFRGEIVRKTVKEAKRRAISESKEKGAKDADAIVLASGNMGLVYFTKWSNRMTLEEINEAYPKMVNGLSQHEGVSFVMILTKEQGAVVISARGKYYLANDRIEGENPLAKFGPRAAAHLRREDSFNYVPDILLMSMYDAEKGEVAAFEELVGSHGGLGGTQSKPFIMHPSEWNLAKEDIVGAENVCQLLKKEMANISKGDRVWQFWR